MRWTLAAILLCASASLAQAQTPLTGTTGAPTSAPPAVVAPATPAPRPRRVYHTLQERFDLANTTHDGHLTKEQARSKMPSVARDFDAIDTNHQGYVTMDDIKAHAAARRAARRQARRDAKAKAE